MKKKSLRSRGRSPASQVNQIRKGIYILPNLFTTGGLFAGFYAIVQATKGHYDIAAISIFVAQVMDGLDGRIARLTNTSSDFGKEYDSLVDVICFGLTPALVVYEWSLHDIGKVGWLFAFLFVAATALRLARFNVQDTMDRRYFQGLPCPAAAGLMASIVWVIESEGFQGGDFGLFALAITISAALAMVSNIPYRSFKDLDLKGRVSFVYAFFVVLILVVVSIDPPRVLFMIAISYFFSGPLMWLYQQRKQRRLVAGEARETDPEAASGKMESEEQ